MPFASSVAGVGGDVPSATSDPREEVLVRFSEGHIVTEKSRKLFSVTATLFKLDDTKDGFYEGEYELITSGDSVFDRPDNPVPPYDTPVGPVEHITINAYTKGRWTFANGDSIDAIGNANFHAVETKRGGDILLWLTGDQIITGGTGTYKGAQGLKILSGSASVAKFPVKPWTVFAARTVDCFRIVRAQYIFTGA